LAWFGFPDRMLRPGSLPHPPVSGEASQGILMIIHRKGAKSAKVFNSEILEFFFASFASLR
jgi:hypothetical protein